MGKYVIISGDHKGKKFNVLPGTTIIAGRVGVDLIIHDSKASRKHCEFRAEEDTDFVKDLDSRNGTFVDGNKITELELFPGQRIQVGKTMIEYVGLVDPFISGNTVLMSSAVKSETEAIDVTDTPPEEKAKPSGGKNEDTDSAEDSNGEDCNNDSAEEKKTDDSDSSASGRYRAMKEKVEAAKRRAIAGKEAGLISAKGRFCEACGEPISAEECVVFEGQYLCRMCGLIAEKQKQTGADLLPSFAKIVSGRMPGSNSLPEEGEEADPGEKKDPAEKRRRDN